MNTPRYNLDTCAMLVEFNASVWTARKLDKTTTDEVVANKNATGKDAARVNKHLLAGRTELDVIQQAVGRARSYVYDHTLPWSDSGLRLLPTKNFMSFTERMNDFDEEIEGLVKAFVAIYPTLITAQAMALGDMFRRDDYPTANEIMTKFAFRVNYMPVPVAGDFRVDIGEEGLREMQAHYEGVLSSRLNDAMRDAWDRLHGVLTAMSERLADTDEGKRKIFRDSLVDNAVELCQLLKHFNIIVRDKLR